MDVGEVLSYANAFSHAVIAQDKDLIASYLCEEAQANLNGQLDFLSPTEMAEVLSVAPLGDEYHPLVAEEFVTVTNFWGAHEEFQLRAVWIQNPHQLLMRRLQVIERKAKV
jgi:hypothetical protein